MEVLHISCISSPREFQRICAVQENGGKLSGGTKFHNLIREGLCAWPDVHVCALVGRAVDVQIRKGVIWKRREERVSERLEYDHLGFINLPVVKQLEIGIKLFFHILKWSRQTKGQARAVYVDGAWVTALPFVMLAKTIGRCPAVGFFCDIYDYMAHVKGYNDKEHTSLSHRIMRWSSQSCYSHLDGFVLMTEAMSEVVNKKRRPFIVMEGSVDARIGTQPSHTGSKVQKAPGQVVMYAGGLFRQYGLKNLVDGFMAYQNDEARLWIFGSGDYSDDIRQASEKDPRIEYGGVIPLHEAERKEQEASLLINPRPAAQEFAKYSYPCKNLEYMASGTPLLTTKLPGMPKECYDYVYMLDADTPEAITSALEKIFARPKDELQQKGEAARDLMLREKNNVAQAGRILKLLEGIARTHG